MATARHARPKELEGVSIDTIMERNAAHTHEVEEVFFVLQGHLDVFVQDEDGRKITRRLGPWECISCPAGVIHGYQNDSLEPVYFQVMIGRGKPETMGYSDEELYKRRG